MRVDHARAAAADWVERHGRREPGYLGAYFSGSTVGLPPGAEVPAGSDTDVMLVLDDPDPPAKPGKFLHRGALLEVSHLPWEELASPERVLGSYHAAAAFRTDTVIDDPNGRLRRLQRAVARDFAEPRWVLRRCAQARAVVERGLGALDPAAPWPQAVISWLFPTGVTTHILLVAALRNPTVRLRYLAVRELLAERGKDALYEELLRPLGANGLTAERAEHHLHALARTFDATAAVARTPFPFGSDLTPGARPIAIDSPLAHIRAGRPREVVFWLAVTYARCHLALAADAPALGRELAPDFDALLADLGITSPADLAGRARLTLDHLPAVWEAAEDLVHAPATAGPSA